MGGLGLGCGPAAKLMRISERQFGTARVFEIQGALVAGAPAVAIQEAVEARLHTGSGNVRPPLVVVSLARVPELDCDGLCALGRAERAVRKAGGTLRVALPANGGRHPAALEHVRALFDAFDSVEDALADLRASMSAPRVRLAEQLRRAWRHIRARRRHANADRRG